MTHCYLFKQYFLKYMCTQSISALWKELDWQSSVCGSEAVEGGCIRINNKIKTCNQDTYTFITTKSAKPWISNCKESMTSSAFSLLASVYEMRTHPKFALDSHGGDSPSSGKWNCKTEGAYKTQFKLCKIKCEAVSGWHNKFTNLQLYCKMVSSIWCIY